MRRSNVVALLLLFAGAGTADAQYRCDCTTVVDTCNAEVVARGSFLEIKADELMCARVDYFVDGQPFVSVVVDGEGREDWLARTTSPRILVQGCQVCRDRGTGSAAAPRAQSTPPSGSTGQTAGRGEGRLEPLMAGVPRYPDAARAGGIRGWVEVELTVTPAGTVENPRVVAAEPRNVFDAAALEAVARRRYPADADREPRRLTERIEFAPPTRSRAAPAVPAARPLNRCVREDAVYNYGDMVDVALINACNEPLVVFGCAQGVGKDRGRWICSNFDERGEVLVATNDGRLGQRYTAGTAAESRTYTYRESVTVTRAPNTQLKWIACADGDDRCRSDARAWTRGVSGQDASIDPQARSKIELGSSD